MWLQPTSQEKQSEVHIALRSKYVANWACVNLAAVQVKATNRELIERDYHKKKAEVLHLQLLYINIVQLISGEQFQIILIEYLSWQKHRA